MSFSFVLAILNLSRAASLPTTSPHSVLALSNTRSPLLFYFTPTSLKINNVSMSAETAATKRQYAAVDIDPGAGSSASEGASRAAPKQNTTAATKKATAKKASTVDKLYNNSIKKIEAAIKTLDGRVLKMGPDSNRVTTDSYAKMSERHLKSVKELDEIDGGLVPAFNLMLYVADASHTDCDTTGGMSGFGDSEAPFGDLDMQLLELIEKRHVQSPATRQEELPSMPE